MSCCDYLEIVRHEGVFQVVDDGVILETYEKMADAKRLVKLVALLRGVEGKARKDILDILAEVD